VPLFQVDDKVAVHQTGPRRGERLLMIVTQPPGDSTLEDTPSAKVSDGGEAV
jgi:hypothetical protein